MTRKNSTVNPKAGTLKQQDRALRTNSQPGFVKSIAFALLLSLSIPSLSIAKDEVADTGKGINERVDISKPDSCCVADKSQNKGVYKIVRLVIPSKEMLRKSDSEANHNLVRSLKENKLNYIRQWILRSDLDIQHRFGLETRIAAMGNNAAADTEISTHFDAENLPVQSVAGIAVSDEDMHARFVVEHQGLQLAGINSLKADEEIDQRFAWENTKISLPTAAQFQAADHEMAVPSSEAGQVLVSNTKY